MSRQIKIRAYVNRLWFCVALLVSSAACAQEQFQLLKTYRHVPDCPPDKSLTLLTEDWQATFSPPQGSTAQLNYEKHELWVTFPDNRCLIKLQFSTNNPELLKPEYTNELHAVVEGRYTNSTVSAGEVCHTSHGLGRSFDIEAWTAYKTKLFTRLVFLPIPNGIVEASMTSSDTKFNSQLLTLSGVVHSLHVEKADPSRLSLRKE